MTNEKLASIITAVILLVVVLAGVVVYGIFSDWFATSFQRFYVSSGKTKFLQEKSVVVSNAKFDVHFVFVGKQAYDVKILPAGTDFVYTVNGSARRYLELTDLTSLFNVEKSEKSFVLRGKDMSLQKLLELVHPGCVIEVPAEEERQCHFKLVVTAGDLTAPALLFRCSVGVNNIELEPGHVYA